MGPGATITSSWPNWCATRTCRCRPGRLLDEVYGPSTRKMLLDAGLGPGTRALDLACGIGAVSCWMATQVGPMGSVVAADVNPDQLVASKWHCAKCDHLPIDYIEASAYATGFPDESF